MVDTAWVVLPPCMTFLCVAAVAYAATVTQQQYTCRPSWGCDGVEALGTLCMGIQLKALTLFTPVRHLCRPQVVEVPLKVAQTAAVMEVLHSALGVVRSPVMITGGATAPFW